MLHPAFLTRLRFRSADNARGVIRPTRRCGECAIRAFMN
ncbi:hypothetical protein CSB92_6650 [Pseudomonas aeruginosa]|nr:hypothetical protein CSC30_1106 [Pseudomonas aeruginosa]AWF63847.1 hypothetical protein CSC27_3387 [Pseudomonas aeruginosa]AZP61258.1 Uncharacterized protein PA1840_4067 [Pseudomonas aeruginosa]PRW14620.1 hypothetical protein CSB92_6650 [Pseudomonas aeruginosa]QJE77335.1 Uncharacterized protein PA52Ts1_2377 [Pseudomonas aeruginosa]